MHEAKVQNDKIRSLDDCFFFFYHKGFFTPFRFTVNKPRVVNFGSLFCVLSLSGSHGSFCKVRQTDKRMLDFYSKLGCFEVAKMEGFPKDVIIMGRSL